MLFGGKASTWGSRRPSYVPRVEFQSDDHDSCLEVVSSLSVWTGLCKILEYTQSGLLDKHISVLDSSL